MRLIYFHNIADVLKEITILNDVFHVFTYLFIVDF